MENTIADIDQIPETPELRREWIKFQLNIRGLSFAKLAREHGASRQAVSMALVRSKPRWERVIAEALGLSPELLWPERYDPTTLMPRRFLERVEARASA